MQEVLTSSRVKKLSGKFTHRVEGWSALSRNVGGEQANLNNSSSHSALQIM